MNVQILRLKLNKVPSEIKLWIGSDQAVEYIKSINQHFNLINKNQKNVIPQLILRLEIKDLEPQYFSGELSHKLGIDKDKAIIIVNEIRRIILNPIKKYLEDYDIDIGLLDKFEIPIVKVQKISDEELEILKEIRSQNNKFHKELIKKADELFNNNPKEIFNERLKFNGKNLAILNKVLDNYIERFKKDKPEEIEKLNQLLRGKRNFAGRLFEEEKT